MNYLSNYFTNAGFLFFTLIKLVGYIALLKTLTKGSIKLACITGFFRTLLGLGIGMALLKFTKSNDLHLELFYLLVTALRASEWTLVLYAFYSKWIAINSFKKIVIATLASTALDLFAVFGLISIDGLIC